MSEAGRTKSEERWAVARDAIGGGRLSVIMPVYNLADTIEANIAQTAGLFESHNLRAELVPVDDGSTDGTAEALARAAAAKYEHVTVKPVVCAKNGGKGAALRAGFDASTGEYVMLLDGDLDINPKQPPFFFEAMAAKGADIVIGSKRHPKSVVQYPWHRRFVSWVYFTLVRMFVGLPITDTQTGMKLFRREVLGESLGRMLVKTYAFDLELLAIAHQRGAKIAEAPVVIRFGNKFGALKPNTVKTMAIDSLAVFYRLRVLRYYAKAEVPPKLDHDPLVSVVIACPRRSWMLDECLAALGNQSYRNFEVIVLPDGTDGGSGTPEPLPEEEIKVLAKAMRAESVEFVPAGSDLAMPSKITKFGTVYLSLEGLVDKAAEAKRIAGELAKIGGFIKSAEAKLANENFVAHAPEAVVAEARRKLAENKEKVAQLEKLAKLFS